MELWAVGSSRILKRQVSPFWEGTLIGAIYYINSLYYTTTIRLLPGTVRWSIQLIVLDPGILSCRTATNKLFLC